MGKKKTNRKNRIVLSFILLSTILVAGELTNIVNFNFSRILSAISELQIDTVIAIGFVLVMASTSAIFYNHKNRLYARNKRKKIKSPNSFRFVYRYIQLTTIIASIGSYATNERLFLEFHNSIYLLYLGLSIAIIGLMMFVSSKITLGEHYSPCFDSFVPRDIVQKGLYKYARHPIYFANVILLLGMFISTGSYWILFNSGLLCVYYLISAIREESVLKKQFPRYIEYIKHTHMFFPIPRHTHK